MISPSRPVGRDSEWPIRSIVERPWWRVGRRGCSGEAGIGKTLLRRSAAAGRRADRWSGRYVYAAASSLDRSGRRSTAIRTSSASTALIGHASSVSTPVT